MTNSKNKSVAIWLLIGVFMIMVQVLLGGITRLTGSGLSITEWKPIMGTLPPGNDADWNIAFDSYKKIAQYKFLNNHFTLDDFKFIFFWEWLHRVWARLLGVVFAMGFLYFLIKKYFDQKMIIPFIILFLLGALQGLIGWIMVQSGLNDTELHVNHIKLSLHFIAALILLCYTLWFALQLLIPEEKRIVNKSLYDFTVIILIILSVQLVYGAFMSGLKAAPAASTWPLINGEWIPDSIIYKSWINDPVNVQFLHRQLAYLLFTGILFWYISAKRSAKKYRDTLFKKINSLPLIFILFQVILGICTLLYAHKMSTGRFGIYELLAEAHQMFAMFLLISLVINFYLIKRTTTE